LEGLLEIVGLEVMGGKSEGFITGVVGGVWTGRGLLIVFPV